MTISGSRVDLNIFDLNTFSVISYSYDTKAEQLFALAFKQKIFSSFLSDKNYRFLTFLESFINDIMWYTVKNQCWVFPSGTRPVTSKVDNTPSVALVDLLFDNSSTWNCVEFLQWKIYKQNFLKYQQSIEEKNSTECISDLGKSNEMIFCWGTVWPLWKWAMFFKLAKSLAKCVQNQNAPPR